MSVADSSPAWSPERAATVRKLAYAGAPMLAPLTEEVSLFNLFRYLTFRSGGAVMTALAISSVPTSRCSGPDG